MTLAVEGGGRVELKRERKRGVGEREGGGRGGGRGGVGGRANWSGTAQQS